MATNFVSKMISNAHLVVCMTLARVAPQAYDKKGNCYVGRRQTTYLTQWKQVNELTD